ncbi:Crp/Fnr family transcriptional regulator [Aurantiacibacter arachoides]|nr:Crp/Fnr family transcriptional regulator [Aurantiacibacter arachoides]
MTSEQGKDPQSERVRKVISRLAAFVDLEPAELERLSALGGFTSRFERGAVIRSEAAHDIYLLVDGWAASAVVLENGSRQLISVNLPGDILGLPGLALCEPIDTVVALTQVEVIRIDQQHLGALFESSPRLAAIMFLISQEERSLLMERLALTGQAEAMTRLAALILRLCERSSSLEDEVSRHFSMPLTQRELGELIGISAVHVNALVKQLRTSGIVSIKSRMMTIEDPARLNIIAGIAPWRRSKPDWLPPR